MRSQLHAHHFHEELIVFVFAEMLDCAYGNARSEKELLFGSEYPRAIPLKIEPIRLLPVPCPER